MTTTDQHLTVRELAERYGVAISTIYRWNSCNDAPPRFRTGRNGGHVLYPLREVERWERERLQGGAA